MSDVAVISLADVESVSLAGGSWSKVLVSEHTVAGTSSALGYPVFKGGDDLVMVFSFPSPAYPPTERREPASTSEPQK